MKGVSVFPGLQSLSVAVALILLFRIDGKLNIRRGQPGQLTGSQNGRQTTRFVVDKIQYVYLALLNEERRQKCVQKQCSKLHQHRHQAFCVVQERQLSIWPERSAAATPMNTSVNSAELKGFLGWEKSIFRAFISPLGLPRPESVCSSSETTVDLRLLVLLPFPALSGRLPRTDGKKNPAG